jgi:hypothetical protein
MTCCAHFIRLAILLGCLAGPPWAHATVFRCDVKGATTYQAQPCAGESDGRVRTSPAAPTGTTTPKQAVRSNENSAPQAKQTCVGDELSLSFRNIALPVVLQVLADFSGRRANVDPAITETAPMNYGCTPWRQVLQDIAQRHRLNILVEEKWIVVRRR